MADLNFETSPAFADLTEKLCRFLDQLPELKTLDQIAGHPLSDVMNHVEGLETKMRAGERVSQNQLVDLAAGFGFERGRFDAAASEISKAAIKLREDHPEMLAADSEALQVALQKGLSKQPVAMRFVAARTNTTPDNAQTVIYGGGGDIPDISTGDPFLDCAQNCNLAAALAFGSALASALERSAACAGSAFVPIVAFLCLIIMAVAFVLAAKAAEKTAELCIEACG